MPAPTNLGALHDTRRPAEKEKDFLWLETVASAVPVQWVEKSPSQWRSFSLRNQDGSSSCVAQSIAKLAEISYYLKSGEKVPFSASFYRLRSNYPGGGMIGVNAFDIWRDFGITGEKVIPSQNLNESQMNAMVFDAFDKDTAIAFKIDNFVQFTPKQQFDDIASTIQKTGKGVMVWFLFDNSEWTDIPYLSPYSRQSAHHSVVAVDAVVYQGKQYLVIEDSWGNFNKWQGRRLISREFYEARNTFGAYPMDFKFIAQVAPVKPKVAFERDLKFSPTFFVDEDVKKLQDILKSEGFFPTNIASTGYYGAVTARAVLSWQKKYRIAPLAELDSLKGHYFGRQSREAANQLYQ